MRGDRKDSPVIGLIIMRGYTGLSLFGRTQTWVRISNGAVTSAHETADHPVASVAAKGAK